MELTEKGSLLDDGGWILLVLSEGGSGIRTDSLHEPPDNSGDETGCGLCTDALPGENRASFVMTATWKENEKGEGVE